MSCLAAKDARDSISACGPLPKNSQLPSGLSLLGLAGYTPNVVQTEQVQLTLRTLYALVPSVCNIIAFIIVLAYPISSRVHAQIRDAIAERKAGNPVADPLRPDQMIS